MSGAAARSVPVADPRRCVGCARPFGSDVPYCPFCGVAQRPEPPPVREPPKPIPLVPPVIAAAPVPVAETVAPVEPVLDAAPQPMAPVRVRPGGRRLWRAWLAGGLLVVGGVAWLLNLGHPVEAGLIVRVHGPDGALVQTGRVLVNDRPAGAPGQTLHVPAGSVTVAFARPGWSADPRTVSLAAHGSATVDLTARELPGHLTLTTDPPGAAVAYGGRNRGRTPFSADLEPGSYDISVSLGGYVGKVVTLNLVHGQPATISLVLTPAPPRRVAAPFDRGVIVAPTALSAAPATSADTLAVLDPGAEVQVLARMASDPAWLQVRAGNRTGYVPAAGSVEPWQSWAQRNSVAGPVDSITPDLRVVIGGGTYPLAGVQAPPGNVLGLDAALFDTLRGLQLRCMPRDTVSYGCITPDGRDVALLYLLNGAAVVGDGAPSSYADAERSAREQRRGVWAD